MPSNKFEIKDESPELGLQGGGVRLGSTESRLQGKKYMAASSAKSYNEDPDLLTLINRPEESLYNVVGGGYEMREDEIAIDLFCGAGGTSEGIRQAIGESPMFALNHNPDAIGVHDANHPNTRHLLSDVFAMDPDDHVPANKRIGLLTASPSCVHFSTARGGKPLDREIRDQAWVVVNWAEHPNERYRPRVIVVENVREFLTWAPLNSNQRIDKRCIDKNGLGSTFRTWRERLVRAGYAVEYKVHNAADYGVGTNRRRLLIVARRDNLPIRFPKRTHAPANSQAVLDGELAAYQSAAMHMDFTIKCNPIMMYPEDAKKARCNRPLADNTYKRIAAGVEKYVIETDEPYIISYYGPKNGENFRGQPVSEPLPTQTTGNRFAFINAQSICRPATIHADNDESNNSCLSPSCGTAFLNAPMLKGNIKSTSISATIANDDDNFFGSAFIFTDEKTKPMAQAFDGDTDEQAVIIPSLIRVNHGDVDHTGKRRGRSNHNLQEPLPTQPTSNEFALVAPHMKSHKDYTIASMVQTGYGERAGQAARCLDIRDPIGTLVAGGGKHAIVEANMQRTNFRSAIFMAQDNFTDIGRSASDPLSTVTTVVKQGIVGAGIAMSHDYGACQSAMFMAQHNADNVGHALTDPISTMTTAVSHQNLVSSHLLTMRQNGDGQSVNDPISTLCAGGTHHGEIRTCLVKYYDSGNQDQNVGKLSTDAPARHNFTLMNVPTEELGLNEEQRFEAWWTARFMEVYGTQVDSNPNLRYLDGPRPSAIGRPGAILWTIEMRMLVPKEAFSASSFPKDYKFEHKADGSKISKTKQMALVGNAVPPGLARAIISANCKPKLSLGELPREAA